MVTVVMLVEVNVASRCHCMRTVCTVGKSILYNRGSLASIQLLDS